MRREDGVRFYTSIACDVDAISKKTFLSTTVRVLKNTLGMRSGTESLPEVFLHDNCEQIYYHYFFCLSQKRRNEKQDSFYIANMFLPAVYSPAGSNHQVGGAGGGAR